MIFTEYTACPLYSSGTSVHGEATADSTGSQVGSAGVVGSGSGVPGAGSGAGAGSSSQDEGRAKISVPRGDCQLKLTFPWVACLISSGTGEIVVPSSKVCPETFTSSTPIPSCSAGNMMESFSVPGLSTITGAYGVPANAATPPPAIPDIVKATPASAAVTPAARRGKVFMVIFLCRHC